MVQFQPRLNEEILQEKAQYLGENAQVMQEENLPSESLKTVCRHGNGPR